MRTNLKTIGWIGAAFTITGTILNAHHIIWCWPIWMTGNVLWLYWSYSKKEWAQFVLFVSFQIGNMWGWYQWSLGV